ncbi:hypothetical protein [Litoribacillus peritrichatus]
MKKHFTLGLLILTSVSACNSLESQANYLEPLYSVNVKATEITFEVKSNGCTRADDFHIGIAPVNETNRLWIERLNMDRCRKMPRIIEITKGYDGSKVDIDRPIILENLLLVKPANRR